jgi:hypothetical protein
MPSLKEVPWAGIIFYGVNIKRIVMPDNKNKQDARDRNQVAGNENYELGYLVEKLGVTRQQVLQAINAVGNNRSKIEEYLRNLLNDAGVSNKYR